MSFLNKCLGCLECGCTKDIFSEYYYNGQKEVYSDMFFNTLDIFIPKDSSSNQICEQCVIDLRSAAEFKRKVLNSRDHLKIGNGIKLEYYNDFDDHIGVDFDYEHREPAVDEVNGQHFRVKMISKNNPDADEKPPASNDEVVMTTKHSTDVKPSQLIQNENIKDEHQKYQKIKQTESQHQKDLKHNSLNLIFNSNLCLFKSFKTKFGCFVCEKSYLTIQELKQHFKIHSFTKQVIETKFNRLRGLSNRNAEISSLKCTNCEEACSDLTELKNHLIEKHGVVFGNAEHLLIPYKLENSFDCVLCNEKFNTYMTLSVHMNQHYSNNVCEVCGNSFINRISLRIHLQSRHKEKKCSLCSETFSTNYARVRHMRTHHNSGLSKRYCLICGRTFRYTYLLEEHKIQEHGAKRRLSKCNLCPKTFPNTQNLKVHVRSVHVKERNFPCHICDMRFFTKFDQKRHAETHDDLRSYVCSLCESKFKGKDSLRRHIKRQHGQLNVGIGSS